MGQKIIRKAGLLIYDQQQNGILLIQKSKSKKWGLPKGHYEDKDNDDLKQTAKRETLEEICLTENINYTPNYNIYKEVKYLTHESSNTILTLFFATTIGNIDSAIVYGDKEIQTHKWIKIEEVPNYITNKEIAKLILDVYSQGVLGTEMK